MTSFSELVAASARVGATAARSAKVRELAALLRRLEPQEIGIAVDYLSGDLPQGQIGVGSALLRRASSASHAADASHASHAADTSHASHPTDALSAATPDAADAAAAPDGAEPLSIAAVDGILAEVAGIRGARSQVRREQALRTLFARSGAADRHFLLRLLAGELRQGALAGVMSDAIAAAADVPAAEVRRAAMVAGGLSAIARAALAGGIEALAQFELELFAPLAPMLAQSAGDVAEALERLGGEAAFEWKMDGARIQVHKSGGEVRIYTRSLGEVTAAVPEIVERVRELPEDRLILDGEAISFDASGRPQPFQITMRRFGRKLQVGELRATLPIQGFFFDCLYLAGRSLLARPGWERIEALARAVPGELRIPRLVTASQADASAFYDAAIAAGHEGIMAKSLDAPYEAGNRGSSWLKIKRTHTLDLVVLAAEWGHGRRTGVLSNLHLGARDPSSGEYVMLGKTFKGLTDARLAWQTRELLARELRRDSYTVYVRPELVVEIAFNDLQASVRYPGGLALRLARVKRYRDDKGAEDADTLDTVRRIYAAQGVAAASGAAVSG